MLNTFHLVENYLTGEIVFGISRIPNYKGHEQILLDVPKDLFIPSDEHSTLLKAVFFIINNPWYSLKLMFLKIIFFLSSYRPYYSIGHTVASAIFLIPSYYFILKEWKYLSASLKPFFFLVFILTIGIIMLTVADWDCRFIVTLLPVIFLLSVKGWIQFIKHLFILLKIQPYNS